MNKAILTPRRTAYGKAVRKDYDAGNTKYKRKDMTQLEPRTDGVSNTLTTVQKDNLVLEWDDITLQDYNSGYVLTVEEKDALMKAILDGKVKARIRKLTEVECLRLMDVSEEDIAKMKASGVARTNLYKAAGNSIVVSCMTEIFRNLFYGKPTTPVQTSLFDFI